MRGRKPGVIVAGSHPVNKLPAPPKWLSKDAKAEWKRVGPIIEERKILTAADIATFTSYCSAVGLEAKAVRIIEQEGPTYMGASGPKKHPAVSIQLNASAQIRLLAAELGLTPVSRSRPAMCEDDDADSLLDI